MTDEQSDQPAGLGASAEGTPPSQAPKPGPPRHARPPVARKATVKSDKTVPIPVQATVEFPAGGTSAAPSADEPSADEPSADEPSADEPSAGVPIDESPIYQPDTTAPDTTAPDSTAPDSSATIPITKPIDSAAATPPQVSTGTAKRNPVPFAVGLVALMLVRRRRRKRRRAA